MRPRNEPEECAKEVRCTWKRAARQHGARRPAGACKPLMVTTHVTI